MAQVTGVCTIKLDGEALRTKEGASLDFGGKERTAIYANGRLVGYAENPIGATVSGTLAHTADFDPDKIRNAREATLIFECDSGPTYLISNAFSTSPPSLTGGEGDTEVEFMGDPAVAV